MTGITDGTAFHILFWDLFLAYGENEVPQPPSAPLHFGAMSAYWNCDWQSSETPGLLGYWRA